MKAGYKQTEIGVIPEDWEVVLLPNALDFISGKAHEQYIQEFGSFTVVNSKFISTNGTIAKYSTKNFCPARNGDILMVMSDLPNGKALAKCFIVECDNKYAVNQRVCILRPKKGISQFFSYQLSRNPYFLAFNDGVSQTHLLNGVFRACPVIVPPFPEQQAIAEALSDVDQLIASLDQLIEKRRALKTATMQQLLTGKTRLAGFSGEWETKRLEEVGSCHRGVAYKGDTDLAEYDTDNTIRLLRSNNVQDAKILPVGVQYVTSTRVNERQILSQNDILICMANGSKALVGKSGLFNIDNGYAYTFGAFMSCFRTEVNAANEIFVSYLFQSELFRYYVGNLLAGSSINNLTPKSVELMEFMMPSKIEQKAIAEVLSDMDAEITELEQRRDKTQAIKQGMMQELLTGRTRLI